MCTHPLQPPHPALILVSQKLEKMPLSSKASLTPEPKPSVAHNSASYKTNTTSIP